MTLIGRARSSALRTIASTIATTHPTVQAYARQRQRDIAQLAAVHLLDMVEAGRPHNVVTVGRAVDIAIRELGLS